MQVINYQTLCNSKKKEVETFMRRHSWSSNHSLYDCYSRPSFRKEDAYDYCLNIFAKKNGTDARIVSYNSMMFTFGFYYTDSEHRLHFVYITKTQDRDYIL